MRPALKLNAIEQEHLQELYDAAGVARDELPYTEQFTKLVQDFQDRTFKNAEPEQVYGALLKYVRSSTCPSGPAIEGQFDAEQIKALKLALRRHAKAGKLLPYSSEFEQARKEFAGVLGKELAEHDFWLAICKTQGRSRKPPKRAVAKVAKDDDEDSGGDDDE
jgi:hypothetical protein